MKTTARRARLLAMFVPVASLADVAAPSLGKLGGLAFVLSGAVELFQGLYLPPRSAQFVDVVSNTLGALIGALLATLFIRVLRAARDESERDRKGDRVGVA